MLAVGGRFVFEIWHAPSSNEWSSCSNKLPPEADNCVRESKNSNLIRFLSFLTSSQRVKLAALSFGRVGHTHGCLGFLAANWKKTWDTMSFHWSHGQPLLEYCFSCYPMCSPFFCSELWKTKIKYMESWQHLFGTLTSLQTHKTSLRCMVWNCCCQFFKVKLNKSLCCGGCGGSYGAEHCLILTANQAFSSTAIKEVGFGAR